MQVHRLHTVVAVGAGECHNRNLSSGRDLCLTCMNTENLDLIYTSSFSWVSAKQCRWRIGIVKGCSLRQPLTPDLSIY